MADLGKLEDVVKLAKEVTKLVAPDWDLSEFLKHPLAVAYGNGYDMLLDLEEGDQIMVRTSAGYWHHGIYVGGKPVMVVDVWGVDKESAKISARPYEDFVRGALGFAKANYPAGAALSHEDSKALALRMAELAAERGIVYHAAFCNCEHFATVCRCLRNDSEQVKAVFDALTKHLAPRLTTAALAVSYTASAAACVGSACASIKFLTPSTE